MLNFGCRKILFIFANVITHLPDHWNIIQGRHLTHKQSLCDCSRALFIETHVKVIGQYDLCDADARTAYT